jgi:hypothetical protein
MPYREDVAALRARVETLERELAAAESAVQEAARLRAELTAAKAQLQALMGRGGGRAARASSRSARRRGAVVAVGLVGATVGATWALFATVARPPRGHAADDSTAVNWPPSPAACLNALPAADTPDDVSLSVQFDVRRHFKAALAPLKSEPPSPRTSQLWGSPTLTITASSRATTASAFELTATWWNTTGRRVAILAIPTHRRNDAAYALFVRDEQSGRSYRLRAFDTSDWCGTTNLYRPQDLLQLPTGAGAGVDFEAPWQTPFDKLVIRTPGVYTIWLAYQFCGYGGERGAVSRDVNDPDLFVGVVVSNGVRVEVTAP